AWRAADRKCGGVRMSLRRPVPAGAERAHPGHARGRLEPAAACAHRLRARRAEGGAAPDAGRVAPSPPGAAATAGWRPGEAEATVRACPELDRVTSASAEFDDPEQHQQDQGDAEGYEKRADAADLV